MKSNLFKYLSDELTKKYNADIEVNENILLVKNIPISTIPIHPEELNTLLKAAADKFGINPFDFGWKFNSEKNELVIDYYENR